jgi:hypothetical protein
MASEPPSDAGWTPWEPRTVKFNSANEAAKRLPTMRKLGPSPGTFVEAQLRPTDGDHEPISAINKIDKYGNFFLQGRDCPPAGLARAEPAGG